MTLEKARRMNLGGCRRSIWTSLTAFVALLMPVANGCALTVPAANAFGEHSAKAPAEDGDQSIRSPRCRSQELDGESVSQTDLLQSAPEGRILRCVGPAGVFRRGAPRGVSITALDELRGHS
jgi:hypothetical protein